MLSFYFTQFKSFLKSYNSIFIFVLPLVLLLIMGRMWPGVWVIPSIIGFTIMVLSFFIFGTSFIDIKEHYFFRQMATTRLNKMTLLFSFLFYAGLIILISVTWTLFWGWFLSVPVHYLSESWTSLFPNSSIPPFLTVLNWGIIEWWTFFYAVLVTAGLSLMFAYVFLILCKTTSVFIIMSTIYLIAIAFAGGVFFPEFAYVKHNRWPQYIVYLFPQYYSISMMIGSFAGGVSGPLIPALQKLSNLYPNNVVIANSLAYLGYIIPWNWSNPLSQALFYAPYLFASVLGLFIITTFKWREVV